MGKISFRTPWVFLMLSILRGNASGIEVELTSSLIPLDEGGKYKKTRPPSNGLSVQGAQELRRRDEKGTWSRYGGRGYGALKGGVGSPVEGPKKKKQKKTQPKKSHPKKHNIKKTPKKTKRKETKTPNPQTIPKRKKNKKKTNKNRVEKDSV